MFITCAGIRFLADDTAQYSVAGHLLIFHLEHKSEKVKHLGIKQLPITAKPDYRYISKNAKVDSGDLFMLLTDGLIKVIQPGKNSELNELKKCWLRI
jgi:serine phosphatase RsbU (regulator of sigma subunit)